MTRIERFLASPPRRISPDAVRVRRSKNLRKSLRRSILSDLRKEQGNRCHFCKCGTEPAPCKDGRAAIHAHHHKGYEHRLDIEWLCAVCHCRHDPRPTGERNGVSKLTEAAVAYIRTTAPGTLGLAEKFGVAATTISRARRGKHWPLTAAREG